MYCCRTDIERASFGGATNGLVELGTSRHVLQQCPKGSRIPTFLSGQGV